MIFTIRDTIMNIKFSKEEMATFNAAFYYAKNVEKLPPAEARTKAMDKVLEMRACSVLA